MEVKEFFLERHANHIRNIENLLEPLTEEQIRCRPHPAVNSVAWLMWHIARCEDVGMNIFVAGRPQILDEAWMKRLDVPLNDIGTGMSDDEVSDFSEIVNLQALNEYHMMVTASTHEIVLGLTPEQLDEIAEPAQVRRIISQQALLRDNAMWVENNFSGKPKGWFLAQLGLAHNFGHVYEARVVRSLMGIRGR